MGVTDLLSAASLAVTVISGFITLSIRAGFSSLRAEALRDKEEIRKWIEDKFLPSREADQRLLSMENTHLDLSRRVDDHEQRLRRVERRSRRNVADTE